MRIHRFVPPILVFGAVCLGIAIFCRREPPEQQFDADIQAVLSGHGGDLYDRVLPGQLETTRASRAQFSAMMDWTASCFKGFEREGRPVRQNLTDGYQVVQQMRSGTSKAWMQLSYFTTPGGMKLSTTMLTFDALVAKYGSADTDRNAVQRNFHAYKIGLAAEQARLENFGLGICEEPMYAPNLTSWSDLRKRISRANRRLDQLAE